MQRSLQIKKLLISLTAAVVVGLLFWVGSNTVQDLHRIQALWQGHVYEASLHLEEINAVRQAYGYGGISHHFLLYLLNPTNEQKQATGQALIRLNQAITRAEQLNLTPLERMALASIAEVAIEYQHAYMQVRGLNQTSGISLIDMDGLQVNDEAAVNALRLLDELTLRRVEHAELEARERLESSIRGIYTGALLIPLVLLLTYLLLHFLNRISQVNLALTSLGRELDALLDHAPEAMLMIGAGGRVLRVNARAEGLFEYRREELMQMQLSALLTGCEIESISDLAALQAMQGSTQQVRARGGKQIAVELAIGQFYEDGRSRLIITLRDISGRLRSQQHIEQLNKSLLRQNRELETVNRELEAFSYSVSHDLRTPLRGIDGFSQLLSKRHASQLDATGKDYLQRIINATARMGQIIDDLLQLSRTSRVKIKPAYLNLSRMVHEVLQQLTEIEPERQVEWDIQPGLYAIGDEGLLHVVLENLLGNAWKYSSTRATAEIRFTVSMRHGEKVFTVCDNGVGFDMQYANKLFTAFQRLHGVEEFEGSGIGLSTVQRIIHRHGGRIWAESAPDHGACFYFTLALGKDEEAKDGENIVPTEEADSSI